MGLIFRLFGKYIQRQLAANALRPAGFDGMTYAFSGLDGKAYYGWMDLSDMPPVRQKQVERCLSMANAGISEKTLNELCDIAEVAIMNALRATKPDERSRYTARCAAIIAEIRRRPTEIIPEDVYYDMASVFAIREDEDPRKFDPVIHAQKIDMLTKAGNGGQEFFMKLSAFRRVVGSSLTSEQGFIELLSGWAVQRNRMKAVREVYAN